MLLEFYVWIQIKVMKKKSRLLFTHTKKNLYPECFDFMTAEPHSSVCSIADLRTGGCWLNPRLGQYSFQGLLIVIATGFIPSSPLSVVSTRQRVKKFSEFLFVLLPFCTHPTETVRQRRIIHLPSPSFS